MVPLQPTRVALRSEKHSAELRMGRRIGGGASTSWPASAKSLDDRRAPVVTAFGQHFVAFVRSNRPGQLFSQRRPTGAAHRYHRPRAVILARAVCCAAGRLGQGRTTSW
jgi:hypothetical protein